MEDVLRRAFAQLAGEYGVEPDEVEISYPEEAFGDFSTNIALKLAGSAKLSPRQLAESLVRGLPKSLGGDIRSAEIAGPGFINVKLSDQALLREMSREPGGSLAGQTVVAEFSDPNPFKILHAGHLYTSVVGDSIANLLEIAGAKVFRVNYGGDVGLHVGKTLWAMLKGLGGEHPERLEDIAPENRSEWMSQAYVSGNEAYESDQAAKQQIIELNKQVYEIHSRNDRDSALAKIYWTTRQWSYDAFNKFYDRIHVRFDRFYPESEATPIGVKTVKEQLGKGVFEKSDGAVVFRGEPYGLHTRVFINSSGLPTYEAKEIGLAELKKLNYNYDRSVIITANEQEQYMAVVLKALEQFAPDLALYTTHLTHGMVRLSGGKKMSSRAGNILKAEDVLVVAGNAAEKVSGKVDDRVVLAAVKYAFLKQRLGGDIIYEPEESVNVLGNSGPYLQYAHARARSILAKASPRAVTAADVDEGERPLVLKLSRFASVVNQAANELSPHLLCTYLYETAQVFNRFYEQNRVIESDREDFRLGLVKTYADRLEDGLKLLGIEAPDRL